MENLVVYGNVCGLDVKKFTRERWRNDTFGAWGSPFDVKVSFIPDERYAIDFGANAYGRLPESAKAAYAEYERAYATAKSEKDGTARANAWRKAAEAEKAVGDAIWAAIAPKWKGVRLVEITATDDWGDEEKMYSSFGFLHNPKFSRIISNH